MAKRQRSRTIVRQPAPKAPAKAPAKRVYTVTLKRGAAFDKVGLDDFTLRAGETREVSEAIARGVEGLFEKGVLPGQLRSHLIVEGLGPPEDDPDGD